MADSELGVEMDVDEPKKKMKKVLQKYRPCYEIKYRVIRKSLVDDNHEYCTVCTFVVLSAPVFLIQLTHTHTHFFLYLFFIVQQNSSSRKPRNMFTA